MEKCCTLHSVIRRHRLEWEVHGGSNNLQQRGKAVNPAKAYPNPGVDEAALASKSASLVQVVRRVVVAPLWKFGNQAESWIET